MQGGAKVKGLESALRTLEAAFPGDLKKQQQLVHGAMGGSARKSILPIAKQLAKRGDSSGALSEALKVRVQSRRKRYGKAGGMEVTPVRYDKKAIALYISHYLTEKGQNASTQTVVDGIRHGHLVEFGTSHSAAFPFLWPAGAAGKGHFLSLVAGELTKRIESRVKREARKKASK